MVGPPSSADLLALMEEVMTMDEIVKRYYTEELLGALTQEQIDYIRRANPASSRTKFEPLPATARAAARPSIGCAAGKRNQ
jgi:hypothetical protein